MDHRPTAELSAGEVASPVASPVAAPPEASPDGKKYVFVCMNVDCRNKGATAVMERLQSGVQKGGVGDVEVRPYMCFGGCHDGPNVVVYPDKVWYAGVQAADADAIVDEHLKKGEPVKPLIGKIDKGLEEMIYQLLDSGIF